MSEKKIRKCVLKLFYVALFLKNMGLSLYIMTNLNHLITKPFKIQIDFHHLKSWHVWLTNLDCSTLISGQVHAPKDHFLAVHELLLGMMDHFGHEAEAMAHKKQKDLMDS